VLVEADFQHVAQRISNLVGCDSVYLFFGCPVLELRHPLLNLFSAPNYCCAGYFGSSHDRALLQHECVRALCDVALQTGQVQSIDQLHLFTGGTKVQSIAVAPFERPAGVLGLVLLTDHRIGTFYHGERQLLSHYLPQVMESLEKDLCDLRAVLPGSDCGYKRVLQLARTNGQSMNQISPDMKFDAVQDNVTDARVQQRLRELDFLKNEFVSMVSHELRTPLTAIKGYTVLLQAYGVKDSSSESNGGEMGPVHQQEYLDIILEQTNHLEILISDLLDVSRIHAGRLSLRCTQVNIGLLCQRAVQVVQHKVSQQYPGRYTFRSNLPPDLPLMWADSSRVQQILTNLLENAVKYSPDGGLIEVLASPFPVMLKALDGHPLTEMPSAEDIAASSGLQEPPMVQITVRDRGIGIPHDQQVHLFKPFSRLEHALAKDIPGVGLGLYITSKLVEAMGGSVTLCSREGEGTSVAFTLPIKPAEFRAC
jgi:signal transduction histidine kinase